MATINGLLITGPVNGSQLGLSEYPWTHETRWYSIPSNGIHSYDYQSAMHAFASGKSIRARAEAKLCKPGEKLGKLGLIWFSAGHGGASVAAGLEGAGAFDYWLALDGLYAGWKTPAAWAVKVAQGAIAKKTVLVATASNTGPGTYADCLASWRLVMKECGVAAGGSELAGFPRASEVYRKGAAIVMGYPDIGHHGQVPAMREGMIKAFDGRWNGGLSSGLSWLTSTAQGKIVLVLCAAGVLGLVAGRK